jgi:hypothetical protein
MQPPTLGLRDWAIAAVATRPIVVHFREGVLTPSGAMCTRASPARPQRRAVCTRAISSIGLNGLRT